MDALHKALAATSIVLLGIAVIGTVEYIKSREDVQEFTTNLARECVEHHKKEKILDDFFGNSG